MARLTDTTLVSKPGTLAPVSLLAGEEVPAWAEGLIGEHLLEDEKPKRPPVRSRSEKSES